MQVKTSKKIQKLEAILEAEIAHRDLQVANLQANLDACETDEQRSNFTKSWNFQDRNQIARINNARATLDYEIAKNV